MARENTVSLYGQVMDNPKLLVSDEGEFKKATVEVRVIRRYHAAKNGQDADDEQLRTDIPIVSTGDEDLGGLIKELKQYDMVEVKGVLTTQEAAKSTNCERCGYKNSVMGNVGFVTAIYICRRETGLSEEEGLKLLHERSEISNAVMLAGTLCRNPKTFELNNGKSTVTQYQLAVNRKYRIRDEVETQKTDYPWIKSFGNQAKTDAAILTTSTTVLVDGAIQTRQFKRTSYCESCKDEYEWEDKTIEVVPYSVEYLTKYGPADEKADSNTEQTYQQQPTPQNAQESTKIDQTEVIIEDDDSTTPITEDDDELMAKDIADIEESIKISKHKAENQKYPKTHRMNLADIKSQLTDHMHLAFEIIGEHGLSRLTEIEDAAFDLWESSGRQKEHENENRGKLTVSRIRMSIKALENLKIVEIAQIIDPLQNRVTACRLTLMGTQIYIDIYDKNPALSEWDVLEAEHESAEQGYGIKCIADMFKVSGFFKSVSNVRREDSIRIGKNVFYEPSIVTVGSRFTSYFEYERGYRKQAYISAKLNKMSKATNVINILVPNLTVLKIIQNQVEKWIKSRGGFKALYPKKVRIATVKSLAGKDPHEHKSWSVVYDMRSGKPVMNVLTNNLTQKTMNQNYLVTEKVNKYMNIFQAKPAQGNNTSDLEQVFNECYKALPKVKVDRIDAKTDLQALTELVGAKSFKLYTMSDLSLYPISLNPCKIPMGIDPQTWINTLVEIYCRTHGLLERGKSLLAETFYYLYERAGVFAVPESDADWRETVSELSRQVTITEAYERTLFEKRMLDDPTNPKGRTGSDTRDSYARLVEKLSVFNRDYSVEKRITGSSNGIGIDELVEDGIVTILEAGGLENSFREFIFELIANGPYGYQVEYNNSESNRKSLPEGFEGFFENYVNKAVGYNSHTAFERLIINKPEALSGTTLVINRLEVADITSFVVQGQSKEAIIDEDTVVLTASGHTVDIKNLAPTIMTSPKTSISPASGVPQNFTKPVKYTVTTEDGLTKQYTVSLTAERR